MNFSILRFLLVIILFTPSFLEGQHLVINEFMSSNQSVLRDMDGDYSDWIELYNKSYEKINLENYYLSDDDDDLQKWPFPKTEIAPYGYFVIFASGKNIDDSNEPHTNFKISQSGEVLYLSNNEGKIIHSIGYENLLTDHSYGCFPDGSDVLSVFTLPTPGKNNLISNQIYASHTSGFYDDEFLLTLKPSNKNQTIYYTLNGSIPTKNSNKYSTPIKIKNISNTDYSFSSIPTTPLKGQYPLSTFVWKKPKKVYKTNVVKFASFENDSMVSDVFTKTFFVDPKIKKRYNFPIISLTTDSLNLFDYDTGIYIPGKKFDKEGFNWWPIGNYHNRGREWERKVHLSYFEKNGDVGFETNAGIRMRGFGSTSLAQKSLTVYFRNDYGLKKVEYPIFERNNADAYKRLILRNSGNDFLYTLFRDALLQNILKPLDLELQNFRPSILFINGEYWGIHNIREKYDEHYFKYHFDIEEDNINILRMCGDVEVGSNKEYKEVANFLEENDLSLEENYLWAQSQVDIPNIIDFFIAEIFYANYDWPCNNYKIWKTNDRGSKWRFLIYDLDMSFAFDNSSLFNKESMEHATALENKWPHCDCSNQLFRNLLKNEDFKNSFIQRFAFHLSHTFEVKTVLKTIDDFEALYKPHMKEHIERWRYPSNSSAWEDEINKLRDFAKNRPCFISENIKSFFELEEFDFDCTPSDFNNSNIVLAPNPNNGNFFVQNKSLENITGNIKIISTDGKIVYTKNNIPFIKNQRHYISLQNINSGTYILSFNCQFFTEFKRIVIIK